MNIEVSSNNKAINLGMLIFKKTIITALVVALFMSLLLTELVMDHISSYSVIKLVIFAVEIFLVTATILFTSLYTWKDYTHQCPACKTKWCYVKSDSIVTKSSIKKFGFMKWFIMISVCKCIYTFVCNRCGYKNHKKVTSYSFEK